MSATESSKNKETTQHRKFTQGKKEKEVKGVVDEPPAADDVDDDAQKREKDLDVMKEVEGVKGLPHQQVPQPGDFSTQALDENL
ncbi:hypothetical protein DITRI_Ditri16bG0136100 [Diplodiscus trichospermus]